MQSLICVFIVVLNLNPFVEISTLTLKNCFVLRKKLNCLQSCKIMKHGKSPKRCKYYL